jgi:hypothetical protein
MGEFIREFDSIKEASDSINADYDSRIVSVCKGRLNTYKGYKWKYV